MHEEMSKCKCFSKTRKYLKQQSMDDDQIFWHQSPNFQLTLRLSRRQMSKFVEKFLSRPTDDVWLETRSQTPKKVALKGH